MATDWTAAEIRRVGYLVVDLIADHLSALPREPVFRPFPDDWAASMAAEPAPQHGVSPEAILDAFRDTVEPYPFGNGHPRFWGWVNSAPAVMGVFADALASAMNPSCAGGNHAAIHVERQVIAWLREMLDFPADAMGLLVSGGSMATLTALAVARHVNTGVDVRTAGLRGAPQPFRVYQSAEGHSCVRKAVELLGFGSDAIRIVPVDTDYRMDAAALDRAIGEDVAAGARPVAVVASAGTVNTGAIDPIEDIASVCARRGIWLHVDAAYGGPAILTHEYRSQLAPLALADSVALDPHKWMYVPVETGFVMVRDAAAMRDTFSLVPPYIRSHGSSSAVMGLPWFSEYGFQQTRGFRALKVWMCLKYFGLAGYKDAVERDIALARYLADRIRRTAELELLAPPSLSVVCFRYAGRAGAGVKDGTTAGADEGRLDALNRSVLERLQVGGEAFITSTELGGRFALRACIVNHRSMPTDMDRMIDVIVALGRDA